MRIKRKESACFKKMVIIRTTTLYQKMLIDENQVVENQF